MSSYQEEESKDKNITETLVGMKQKLEQEEAKIVCFCWGATQSLGSRTMYGNFTRKQKKMVKIKARIKGGSIELNY